MWDGSVIFRDKGNRKFQPVKLNCRELLLSLQGLWSNAWAKVGDFDGKLCQWRWLLPLLILCGSRMWPNCPCRHLRARMPAHSRGVALWNHAAAEEDQQEERFSSLVDQVKQVLQLMVPIAPQVELPICIAYFLVCV